MLALLCLLKFFPKGRKRKRKRKGGGGGGGGYSNPDQRLLHESSH